MPSQCKGVVSTTFDFQRTGAEISQFSIISHLNFASNQHQPAENGLVHVYISTLLEWDEVTYVGVM